MRLRITILFVILALSFMYLDANAQMSKYALSYNLPVFNGNHLEKYAWVGGLSAPQFCPVDLNNDGIKDLVIFDRTGLKFYTFINRGKKDTIDYYYAPEYEANMPYSHGWVKFYDFNCDGIPDFFNDTSSTVRAFKGYYDNHNRLAFKVYNPYINELFPPYKSRDTINLFSSSVEMPAFEDVDGDGDMDIVNFDVLGYQVLYHQNMAMEKYQRCDTLVFYQDTCWGQMQQLHWYQRGFVCNIPCGGAVPPPPFIDNSPAKAQPIRHSGNTVCLWDVFHTGLKDLYYGNIQFNNITFLHNVGKPTAALFECTTQDTLWPKYNKTANVYSYPAAYHLDVNNDGREDIIISPNDPDFTESFHNVWLYQNLNTGKHDSFGLVKDTFMIEDMIETGKGCNPSVTDVNGDGLPDLVLGNEGYLDTSFAHLYSTLTVYENIGSLTHPQFKLSTRDYMGLSALSLSKHYAGFAPAFADLDGNGTIDMLVGYNVVGDLNGEIMYYSNDSLPGHNMKLNLVATALKDKYGHAIDVGASAVPVIFDFNHDGLPDLIIGNKSGTITYYQNVGTKTVPSFIKKTDTMGRIYTNSGYYSYGYSYPSILHVDSTDYLLVGKSDGKIYRYKMNAVYNDSFKLVDSLVTNFSTGYRSTVTAANISGSYKPEILIGNYRGGLQLLSTDTVQYPKSLAVKEIKGQPVTIDIKVIPNPAHNTCSVYVSDVKPNAVLTVYDAFGTVIDTKHIQALTTALDMSHWAAGIYFVRICNGPNCTTRKLVKL